MIAYAITAMKEKADARIINVAANIRKLREYRNYTQEYLAFKLNISQNAYSKIELGHTKMTIDRLFHIADILETDPVDMLKNSSELLRMV